MNATLRRHVVRTQMVPTHVTVSLVIKRSLQRVRTSMNVKISRINVRLIQSVEIPTEVILVYVETERFYCWVEILEG